jgi:two-component system LytT family response regulator
VTFIRFCDIINPIIKGGGRLRILFCDDDANISAQLQEYVKEYFSRISGVQPEYAVYSSGDALLQQETRADIAFLDVEMPGLSGIHIGAELKKQNPEIKIFIVTSYPDYLDEAMRFQVFRYLSKPVDKERLFRNLKDALYQYNMANKEYAITLETGVEIRTADEIVCVESHQRKCLIHTLDGVFTSTATMEYWRKTLTLPCFYQPHKSYIINMRYVYSVAKDSVTLRYGDKRMEAYLARRKFTQFKDTYLLYLESVQ